MPEAPARRSVASKRSAEYGSARVNAGQWLEAAVSNRPPKASSSVVDYQHPYSLKASFLHLSQQRRCACTSQMAHAILIRFQAVKLLTRKTAVSRVTGHGSCDHANRTGSELGLALDPVACLAGVIRRLPRAGCGRFRVPIAARAPNLRRRPAARHATDTVSPGHRPARPCARNPAQPAPSPG
jgi:hypothetical protein